MMLLFAVDYVSVFEYVSLSLVINNVTGSLFCKTDAFPFISGHKNVYQLINCIYLLKTAVNPGLKYK